MFYLGTDTNRHERILQHFLHVLILPSSGGVMALVEFAFLYPVSLYLLKLIYVCLCRFVCIGSVSVGQVGHSAADDTGGNSYGVLHSVGYLFYNKVESTSHY